MAGLNKRAPILASGRSPRPVFVLTLLTVLCGAALRAQEAQNQAGPQLQVTVNRVFVEVAVTGSDGHFVGGLTRNDFRVFDNEVEQPLAEFLPIEEPAQFLLLVESGPAVLLFAKDHVLAASDLLNRVAADDRVAIAVYSRSPDMLLDLTTDKSLAQAALASIDFHSGYGELNLQDSVAATVDWLGRLSGKKSIVLLSTGVDSSEATDWAGLRKKLLNTDVQVIAVSLSGEIRGPAKPRQLTQTQKEARAKLADGFAKSDKLLQDLSTVTGGRAYFPQNRTEFARAYEEIAELLRHQYILGFAPPVLDGKVHQLRVEVKGEGLKIDHRPAYLATSRSPA